MERSNLKTKFKEIAFEFYYLYCFMLYKCMIIVLDNEIPCLTLSEVSNWVSLIFESKFRKNIIWTKGNQISSLLQQDNGWGFPEATWLRSNSTLCMWGIINTKWKWNDKSITVVLYMITWNERAESLSNYKKHKVGNVDNTAKRL